MIASDRRARSGRSQGSREISHRKLRYLIADPLNKHLFVKGAHRLAQLDEQRELSVVDVVLVSMCIESAELHEKDLSIRTQLDALLYHPRHLL